MRSVCLTYFLVLNVCIFSCDKGKTDLSISKGPYLGQTLPGRTPAIFAPEIVSTSGDEINAVFSPKGKTFYFSRDSRSNLSKAGKDYTIYYMKETDNGWTKPEKVSFAGEYMNGDMVLSINGKQLFFCSDRPLKKGEPRKTDADIWLVDMLPDGWSEPRNLGPHINSDENEWYPCLAKNNTLYFSSSREGGKGKSDLFCAKLEKGIYQKAEPLKGAVNTAYREGDVFIAPDESYLITVSSDRPDTFGMGDLYISYRNEKDEWSEAVNLGKPINTEAHDYCPMVSPDGKYLFYSSKMRGQDDVYWIDVKIIQELRPKKF